jgi:D-aspartate ligase
MKKPTSAHSSVPAIILGTHTMGLGVIRALGEKGVPIVAVYYDAHDVGYVSRYVTEKIRAPHPEHQESAFIDLLIEMAGKYAGAVLFPVSDETLVTVSRNKDRLKRYYLVASTGREIVDRLIDKKYTYALAESIGVPVPKTIVPKNIEEVERYGKSIDYPCLVKPCKSHEYFARFRRKMVWATSFDQLVQAYQEATQAGFEVMLQEFIPGDDTQGVNYNAYFWRGQPLVEFTAQKVRSAPPRLGSPCVAYSAHVSGVLEPGRKLLQALAFYGYACTEFKKDARDGIYKLMEVNGRHNLSTLLAVRAGVNFPWMHYCHLVTGELPSPSGYQDGLYWIDLSRDLYFGLQRVLKSPTSLPRFLAPYFKPHVFAILDLKDPLPFVKRWTGLGERVMPPAMALRLGRGK